MKDFINRNIIFLGVVGITLVLIIGGVFIMSRPSTPANQKKVADDILAPKGSYKTDGIVNGKFQPASDKATVTLVEFGDYQCPACGAYNPLVDKILTEEAGKVNFVFRNFPLPQHANANITSYAAEAAGLQGKFWEMHDKLYASQTEWSDASDAKDIVIRYATELGLDINKFKTDIDSSGVKDKVAKDLGDGNLIGINATPTFFVNGIKLDNPGSYDEFKKIIEDALAKSPITQTTGTELYHAHFDIKVYTNGVALNLSLPKYQSKEGAELNDSIHLHDGNGKVVHLHKPAVALKELFDSIKVTFPANTASKTLQVYVNGTLNSQGLSYAPGDLDKVLVTYGSSDSAVIQKQISTLSNDACIYSEKCPERGKPPTEECVGGLGTGCELKK